MRGRVPWTGSMYMHPDAKVIDNYFGHISDQDDEFQAAAKPLKDPEREQFPIDVKIIAQTENGAAVCLEGTVQPSMIRMFQQKQWGIVFTQGWFNPDGSKNTGDANPEAHFRWYYAEMDLESGDIKVMEMKAPYMVNSYEPAVHISSLP